MKMKRPIVMAIEDTTGIAEARAFIRQWSYIVGHHGDEYAREWLNKYRNAYAGDLPRGPQRDRFHAEVSRLLAAFYIDEEGA